MFLRLIILIVALWKSIDTNKLTILTNDNLRLDKCIDEILLQYCLQYQETGYCDVDILTNYDMKQDKFPKISLGFNKGPIPFLNHHPKLILFDIRAVNNDIRDYLEGAHNMRRPEGTTGIFLLDTIDDLTFFQDAHYFFVETAYFLDKDLNLYVSDPYVYGNASRIDLIPTLLGKCESSVRDNILPKFSRSIKKWQNTTLNIMYRAMPPYVNYDDNGVEQNILRIVLSYLDIKNVSQITEEAFQGEKNELTGNYSKALFLLQYGQADVLVGGFHPLEHTVTDFDGTLIYHSDTLNIIAPKSASKSTWRRLSRIYTANLRILFVVCILVLIIFIRYFYKTSCFTTVWCLFQIVFESPIKNLQKVCTFKVLMSSFLIFCLIYSTSFKTALQLIQFSKEYEKEIHTKDDLKASGLYIYTLSENLISKLNSSKSKDDREVASKIEICRDIITCLRRIAIVKDSVLLFPKIPVLFSIPIYFIDSKTREPLLYVGESLHMVPLQMIFQKNYPSFKDINTVLSRTFESGFIDLEANRIVWYWDNKMNRIKKFSSRVLTLKHLGFIFIILSIGMFLATSLFLGEIIKHHFYPK